MTLAEQLVAAKTNEVITFDSRAQFAGRDVVGSSGGLAFYLRGLVQQGYVQNSKRIAATGEKR